MEAHGPADRFRRLQAERLERAWRADLPGSTQRHVVVGLPSFSLDASVYEHYGARVGPLENRYLYVILRCQEPTTRTIYLSSTPVSDEIVATYLQLAPAATRPAILRRSALLSADDTSPRALAEKVLDSRPALDAARRFIGNDPALIEAWNVGEAERELALALDAPVHGTDPSLRRLATKSGGRALFKSVGIAVPEGVEDVRSVEDVVAAVTDLLSREAALPGVVVKLDDSVAGDGNIVLRFDDRQRAQGRIAVEGLVRRSIPAWYLRVLSGGGVVEALITGKDFASPSGQGTIRPDGAVEVLSTHDQRLGGPHGQVYEGCSFPALEGYAAQVGSSTREVGEALAREGAIGRYGVDFAAVRNAANWSLYALEINLRKGGTTHPFGITRVLTGGRYDADTAKFILPDRTPRLYAATDNLVDDRWLGRTPGMVRELLARADLSFDLHQQIGVIPHLLDCLAVDGRMGYTAIGRSRQQVADLEDRVQAALRN